MRTATEWKKIYTDPKFHKKYTYEKHDLGVKCTAKGTEFRLWSPCAEMVVLNLYKDGDCDDPYQTIKMERQEREYGHIETVGNFMVHIMTMT